MASSFLKTTDMDEIYNDVQSRIRKRQSILLCNNKIFEDAIGI